MGSGTMRKHLIRILIFLILLAILPVTLLAYGALLPSYYGDSYYAVLPEMYQRLNDAEGPKIVVVGGSNVAFGLDTALLEELLAEKGYDYTVCSFGLYAAVGVSAMLDMSLDTLKEGDIVILAIEPTSETMSTYFGASAFWKCAEDAPELLLAVDKDKQAALFGNYISYLQERCNINRSGLLPQAEGAYAKTSFNERCDLVYDRAGNTMALGYDTAAPVDLTSVTASADFVEQVNSYCTEAAKKGASVCLSFSPTNRTAIVGNVEESVNAYFQLCNASFACPVISNPNSYILDSGWFYDSNFHLNTAGTVIRTCTLAEDVLAWLGCYQEIGYDLPPMPDPIAVTYASTGETGYFSFDPVTDAGGSAIGYLVSGLTESGLAQTELTVPAIYEGKPVVGFTQDALSQASALEQLRLPESIESLPDNLFRSCTSLTQLILEHSESPCSITDHTFDSADQIKIFVPSEAYTLYRDGRGCEANPWVSYLDRIFPY